MIWSTGFFCSTQSMRASMASWFESWKPGTDQASDEMAPAWDPPAMFQGALTVVPKQCCMPGIWK